MQQMEPISESRLVDIIPWVADGAREIDAEFQVLHPGHRLRVVEGSRTWAYQESLWQKGRDEHGNVIPGGQPGHGIVTNAHGWQSQHCYCCAVDLCPELIAGGAWEPDYNVKDAMYADMVAIGFKLGFNCGAKWHSIVDYPHFQHPKVPTTPTIAMKNDFADLHRPEFFARVDSGIYLPNGR